MEWVSDGGDAILLPDVFLSVFFVSSVVKPGLPARADDGSLPRRTRRARRGKELR